MKKKGNKAPGLYFRPSTIMLTRIKQLALENNKSMSDIIRYLIEVGLKSLDK